MRTATLLVVQTLAVIGYLTCASTVDAAKACCRGTCHDIPKGCHCPYKAILCGELNALTMGKRTSDVDGDPSGNEQTPPSSSFQQRYRLGRPEPLQHRTDRRLDDNRIIDVLNNLLRLLKEHHRADQEAFKTQDQSDNGEWETSSRKQPSEIAHNVYNRQPIYTEDIF